MMQQRTMRCAADRVRAHLRSWAWHPCASKGHTWLRTWAWHPFAIAHALTHNFVVCFSPPTTCLSHAPNSISTTCCIHAPPHASCMWPLCHLVHTLRLTNCCFTANRFLSPNSDPHDDAYSQSPAGIAMVVLPSLAPSLGPAPSLVGASPSLPLQAPPAFPQVLIPPATSRGSYSDPPQCHQLSTLLTHGPILVHPAPGVRHSDIWDDFCIRVTPGRIRGISRTEL